MTKFQRAKAYAFSFFAGYGSATFLIDALHQIAKAVN